MKARQATTQAANEAESLRDRILRVARELIDQTGDFDLSMRDLAARARVSLRSPYQLFGSKSGIITEILRQDQAQPGPQLMLASDADLVEALFHEVMDGLEFVGTRQPFYRALFRATQAYSGGGETEPAREIQRELTIFCRRASKLGLLRADVAPEIAAEVLTNIFAAEVRYWASSTFDIGLASLRTMFGVAAVLAGLGADEFAAAMRARAVQLQTSILEYDDPSGLEAARLFQP
jgi:AcrR family transcriptional regulator